MSAPEEIKFPPKEEKEDYNDYKEKYGKYIDSKVERYLELDSEDIQNTIKIYPENRSIFYLLWKEAKFRLYKNILATARQAELIIIERGNKKLYEILSKYDIISIIRYYERLILYFDDVPEITRVPSLNLSTVFKKDRQEPIIVHLDGDLHEEIRERSQLFDITMGDFTMINIIKFFADIFRDDHFGHHIMEYINIDDRLKNTIEEYQKTVLKYIVYIRPKLEESIKKYKRDVENGDGNLEILKEKEKMLNRLLRVAGLQENEIQANRRRYNLNIVDGDVTNTTKR